MAAKDRYAKKGKGYMGEERKGIEAIERIAKKLQECQNEISLLIADGDDGVPINMLSVTVSAAKQQAWLVANEKKILLIESK